MRVLAIDASLRNCGVAIVDGENGKSRALFFGTIHNASSLKSSACLVAIRDQLAQLIREHRAGLLRARSRHLCAELQDRDFARRGARRRHSRGGRKRPSGFRICAETNQTSDGRDRRREEKSGCLHDAGLARVNRNARSQIRLTRSRLRLPICGRRNR